MARDTNLKLLDDTTVTATANTTAINVTGGEFAVVELICRSDATGTSPTLDVDVQVSVDGTNYITIGSFPQLSGAANKGNEGTWVAVPVYIPRAVENPDARGVDTPTKMRLALTAGGTTPNFDVIAYVSHLDSVPRGSVAGFTSGNAGRYGPLDAVAHYWG